jgi:hypothetical protein
VGCFEVSYFSFPDEVPANDAKITCAQMVSKIPSVEIAGLAGDPD